MSHDLSTQARRGALAIAIHFAIFSCAANAADEPAKPFPAFLDGHVVPASFDTPGASGYVHHDTAQLANDVRTAVNDYCAASPDCMMAGYAVREVSGASGKSSAYSVLDITIARGGSSGSPAEVTSGGITLVRSCPADAMLVDDSGGYYDNQDRGTGQRPMACLSPDAVPKTASMGAPEESGANQCPIGNSPMVGNPINPLTMSKIEVAVDYAGPASSGLMFARTYHSGAFSLDGKIGKIAARYPAGARIGARWRHTYDRAFVRRPYFSASGWAYTSALHLLREDGGETRFIKKGDTYISEEGERGVLREDADGWVYTHSDLTAERYDDKGRLRTRTDANGNTLTLHYDDITVGIGVKVKVLVRVSDRQGRELKLGYDRYGRIEAVDTPDGRTVKYGYDEPAMGGTPNHKLTGIVGNNGKRFATFRYDSANRAISSDHGDNLERTDIRVWDANRVDISRPGLRDETWVPSTRTWRGISVTSARGLPRKTLSLGLIPYNKRYGAPFKEPITMYGTLEVVPLALQAPRVKLTFS